MLDTPVDAGVARSRAEAFGLGACVLLVATKRTGRELGAAMRNVDAVRDEGPGKRPLRR